MMIRPQTLLPALRSALLATLGLGLTMSALAHARGEPLDLDALATERAERFASADSDGDALLTETEFTTAAISMLEAKGERSSHRMRRMRHHGARDSRPTEADREAREAALFALMDSDGNGELSAQEAGRENRRKAKRTLGIAHRFERLDSNTDGVLTAAEFDAPLARLRAADSDADGVLSRDERKAARASARANGRG